MLARLDCARKMDELLTVEPGAFTFVVTRGEPSTLRVRLHNVAGCPVAFKVRTRQQNQYCVQPARAVLAVGEAREVVIVQAALSARAEPAQVRDKFQLLAFPLRKAGIVQNINADIVWARVKPEDIIKRKYDVRARPAPPQEPAQKGPLARALAAIPRPRPAPGCLPGVAGGGSGGGGGGGASRFAPSESSRSIPRTGLPRTVSGVLLPERPPGSVRVAPPRAKFEVTPGVQAMCIMTLTNKFAVPVAFKAKVSTQDRYRIAPHRCFIDPGQAKPVAIYLTAEQSTSEELRAAQDRLLFLFAPLDDHAPVRFSIGAVWGAIDEEQCIHQDFPVHIDFSEPEGPASGEGDEGLVDAGDPFGGADGADEEVAMAVTIVAEEVEEDAILPEEGSGDARKVTFLTPSPSGVSSMAERQVSFATPCNSGSSSSVMAGEFEAKKGKFEESDSDYSHVDVETDFRPPPPPALPPSLAKRLAVMKMREVVEEI